MPISQNEKKALAALRSTLQDKYRPVDVKVFGSKAKGTDSPESDLDVMIVLEDLSPAIESEIDDLIFDINLEYSCLITALFFSREELERGPLTESPVYKKILQEGIPL